MSPTERRRPRCATWIALLAAASTVALFLAMRRDVVLADDWMLLSYFADQEPLGGFDWWTVLADFWTPWLFSDWSYFRPTTSLCMGAWMDLFRSRPGSWHVLNILMHAANVAMFAMLLHRLHRKTSIVLVAVALVVLHPATTEPVLWFGSVTELVAVFGTLLACLGVCRHRDGRRGAGGMWVLGLWIALTGKENGNVALLLLPLLDRLLGARPAAALLRDHLLRSGAVLAVVLILRAIAGCLDPTGGVEGLDRSVAHFTDSCVTKFGLVVLPGAGLTPYTAAAVAMGSMLIVLVARWRPERWWFGAMLVLVAYLACGTYHVVNVDYSGSRLLYPAVFVAAFVVGGMKAMLVRRRAVWAATIVGALLVLMSARAMLQKANDFQAAADGVDKVSSSLREAYRNLPPTDLLCPLTVPLSQGATLAFLPNLLFPIVEGQVAGANRLLPLTYLTSFVYVSRNEQWRPLPLRMAVELGGTLLNLADDGTPTLLPAPLVRGAANLPMSELRPDRLGFVRLPEVISPLRLETVVVTAAGAKSVEIHWLFAGDELAPAGIRAELHDGVARIQVGDDIHLMAGLQHPLTGLKVTLLGNDGPGPAVESARVQLSSEPARLPPSLHPELITRDELERVLVAPTAELPPGMRLHMGLLLPSSGVSFEVRPGQPVVLPPDVSKHLDWTLRMSPRITMAFWFHERGDGVTAPALGRRSLAARIIVQR